MDNKKKIKSFTDLNAWKEAHKLVLMIYKITKDFSKEEMFGIVSQIRRAAVSIVSNIAEGFSRQTYKNKVRFYFMAQGSLTETQSQLLIAKDLNYITKQDFANTVKQTITTHKLLCGLIKKSKSIHNSQFTIHNSNKQQGIITPLILIITSIMFIFATALIGWSLVEHKDANRKIKKTQALQIAEAGVNYYKWHLEHDDKDYQDGEDWCCATPPCAVCGPYDHQYKDYNDEIVGQFSLEIIPPEVGSTIATVISTGYAYSDANNNKKVTSRVGKRSRAEYSWLSDKSMTFSHTATVTGPVHSNDWINFRGTCGAEIISADNVSANCNVGETPCPKDCPESFWRSGVPLIDFDGFISNLRNIKKEAAADDAVPPEDIGTCSGNTEGRGICYGDSEAAGYWVIFGGYLDGMENVTITGNPVVSIYRIDALNDPVDFWGGPKAEEPKNTTALLVNHDLPDNGLIFLEDDVWIEGTVNGRATVGATKFLNGKAEILINGNIVYSDSRAGSDNLGILCQGDIIMPRHAPDDLTIEASLLSQQGKGLFFRYYYPQIVKSRVENYGGIVTFLNAGVKYGSPVSNGYVDSLYTYNNNLVFSPPPSFPTADNFEVLSWSEE